MRKADLPGAYILTHKPSGLFYVGSSSRLQGRKSEHLYKLNKGIHHRPELQKVYKSKDELDFFCLITEDEEKALDLEQELLDLHWDNPLLVNAASSSRSTIGVRPSEEVRKRWSIIRKGRKHSELTKRRIGDKHKGRVFRDETKQKIRENIRNRLQADPEYLEVLKRRGSFAARKLSVDGVIYNSIREAARELGIVKSLVKQRLDSKSERFSGWKWL